MSKPCVNCLAEIRKTCIRKVYYTNDNGELICESVSELKTEHISRGQRLRTQMDLEIHNLRASLIRLQDMNEFLILSSNKTRSPRILNQYRRQIKENKNNITSTQNIIQTLTSEN